MISFRYHVVSLVAVLLALAVGIALGGGPLQRDADRPDDEGRSLVAAQAEISHLEQGTAFADAYAAATAGGLLDGAIKGRAVTMVALPGADDADVSRLEEMVDRAGGSVTLRATVGQKLLDVGSRQLVAELATQMAASSGQEIPGVAEATGYEQLGILAARALVSTQGSGEPVDDVGRSVLAGLDTAGLLSVTGDGGDRGSLVLVVAGSPYGSADDREGAGSILTSLVSVLDERSDGLVLAGPVASSADDGLVGTVRADPTAAGMVSTVDTVDRTAGAVVAVLALDAEAQGRSGHYGTESAGDGALPGVTDAD